ncbi:4519_t:CDS:2, partial [Funneliformis geosporum]
MDKLNSNLNITLHNSTVRRYFYDVDLSSYSTLDENLDSNDYINILANNFIPWVSNYPNSIFQQDRAL